MAVIPGGLLVSVLSVLSVLELLDTCLNKPFKSRMHEEWNNWILNDENLYTKAGVMHATPLHMLYDFIEK